MSEEYGRIFLAKEGVPSFFNPSRNILVLSSDPLEAAHELAHVRLGHSISGSSLFELNEEREAWKEALRRINPDEIKVSKVERDMNTYLEEVGREYGYGGAQYQIGSRWLEEVISLARKRKKEA